MTKNTDDSSPAPERRISDADVEVLSERIVDRLVEAVSDRRTVDQITAAWSGALDRAIGRGMRRVAGALLLAVLMVGAVKFELLSKLLK